MVGEILGSHWTANARLKRPIFRSCPLPVLPLCSLHSDSADCVGWAAPLRPSQIRRMAVSLKTLSMESFQLLSEALADPAVLQVCKRDLKPLSINMETWEVTATDRTRWRRWLLEAEAGRWASRKAHDCHRADTSNSAPNKQTAEATDGCLSGSTLIDRCPL